MVKITLSINKLFKLLLFSALTCGSLNAQQCPTNITIVSDDDQCGALVSYLVAGGGATQSANGVVNPNGANGLTGWTNSTAFGTSWVVSGSGFISSYNSGSMSQVIDLTTMGMTDAYMDTLPAITVSEQYMGGTPNVGDTYNLTVQLRGEADNILATYTTGNVTCTAAWQTASHVFTGYPAGVRKIFFQHTGDDAEFWAGNYGAMTTNSTVTVAVPTSTVVQTTGIASGEVFPIGTTTNTFTITSEDNVVTTCTFDVIVTDGQAPVAIAQNFTAVLDGYGIATVAAEDINNESTDNCTNLTYSLDVTEFTCEDLGENTVTLSVSDGTNTTTATAIITVVDETAPVIVFEDATIEVDNDGNVTILSEEILAASTDNCSVATYTISPASLSCANLGPNEVTVTVTDASGNSSTETATITVTDATAPTVITQNITLSLPEVTLISINELDIDNGSFDNCGISSYSLDTQVFTCENIGENTVTLTITDNNGNTSTGTAIVTIEDPNAYCPQTVGIEGFDLNDSIIIYPNPTKGSISFDAGRLIVSKIEMFDVSARLVKSFDVAASGVFITDLSSFNAGIYFAKIYSADAFVVKRIVKE
ncbi:T9SS type A sorting domain-containing protein [Flavobacterium zepuense]|uniref:T9SS type A sorting domain-containing protein n=1 Tax=Flavobacterium zepuense TaxID=2593302 RepID=A0A552V1M7_9FLAO|nr:T9SS type A sorting domain-containing protein [Flavobacterium zepuense]TRW24367.1 T9SS type A sorting domain-containing protein [Flavobacterium zepuense]